MTIPTATTRPIAPLALDPEIAALADARGRLDAAAYAQDLAGCWLACAAFVLLHTPHLWTGYMPVQQRRNVKHRLLRDGLVTAPPRDRARERAAALAAQLFGARPVLACELGGGL